MGIPRANWRQIVHLLFTCTAVAYLAATSNECVLVFVMVLSGVSVVGSGFSLL